ncbi:MAG: hypothetical protein ACOC4M_06895 [Promethearchaeia archaeon]
MKTFHKKDGGIVQLIGKEKMKSWSVELPLIFIEYIRSNKLESYDDVKKEVEQYLDEILEDVAVPRLIEILEGEDTEEIISALERIKEIADEELDMTRPIKPYLEDLRNNKNKEVKDKANDILNLFEREERRKELNKRRKEMKEKEQQFMDGKISAEEYAEARKNYIEFRDNR